MKFRKGIQKWLYLGPVFFFIGIIFVSAWSGGTKNNQSNPSIIDEAKIQPVITNQIVSDEGVVLVEITGAECKVTAKGFESSSCRVLNRSNKNITGLTLIWTIIWSNGRSNHPERFYRSMDALICDGLSPLAPGQEQVFESSGTRQTEGDEFIKSIRVSLDYVEFEDHSSMGPDVSRASRQFTFKRKGASMYKNTLLNIYQVQGPNAVIEALTKQDDLTELVAKSNFGPDASENDRRAFLEGARMHRSCLQYQIYYKNGANAIIEKLLSK